MIKRKYYKLPSRYSRLRNRGVTLIEAAMGLTFAAIFSAALAVALAENSEQLQARNSAQKMTEVYEAAQGYLSSNHGALLGEMTVGELRTINVGRVAYNEAIPSDSLQELGFLPASYVDRNSYGHRHALLVRKTDDDRLEALVTTWRASNEGRAITDRQISRVANFIGANGGYIPEITINAADDGQIVGMGGGWRTPISQWSAGAQTPSEGTVQASLVFDNGSVVSDYLYRNDVGVEPLNTMNTDIHMGSNALLDVNNISGVTKTFEGRTEQVLDVTGSVHASIDVWGENLFSKGDISADGNISADGGISADGNITAAGSVVGGEVRSTGNLHVAGLATIPTIQGDTNVTGNLRVDNTISAGTINPDMLVQGFGKGGALDNIPLRLLLPTMVAKHSYPVRDQSLIPKPRCAPGVAKVMLFKQNSSFVSAVVPKESASNAHKVSGVPGDAYLQDNIEIYDNVIARDISTSWWQVEWMGSQQRYGHQRTAIAQTYCSYDTDGQLEP